MKLKTYELVICITGGIATIASGLVAYFNPAYSGAIVSAIDIASTAIASICALFIKKETTLKK